MANIGEAKSLKALLAEQLPKDVPFTIYHYSTPPTRSPALFSAPPNAKSERTYCESHTLAAAVTPKDAGALGLPDELLILAIEVLIYTTRTLTTIFVSKADSTGCLSELQLPRSQSGSPLRVICGTFVSWLARERQREGRKLVVSLFARAQDQYLFPASIDNNNKHVLDDRGLVKWWCKVLDPIVKQYKAEEERKLFAERLASDTSAGSNGISSPATAKGYLVIPGFELYDTLRYTPPSHVPNTPRRWAATHPLREIAPYPAAPPRCLVPHFPDDPKARFLDELDEELPDRGTDAMLAEGGTPSRSNGVWKSVKSLDQFWEFMAYRQECSSGRIVGFIWVVITPEQTVIPEEDEEPSQLSAPQSQVESQKSTGTRSPGDTRTRINGTVKRKKPTTEYGPIPLRLPRIKQTLSNLSTMSSSSGSATQKDLPESTVYYKWPLDSRGSIVFPTKDYNRAHEILIHQNFSSRSTTVKATIRWRDEIGVLGGVAGSAWGWTVVGELVTAAAVAPPPSNGVVPVTVMGVRKKRKPEVAQPFGPQSSDGIQPLSPGLVRKKPKVEPTPAADATTTTTTTNGINTLATGLVRKKPKT